MSNDTIQDREMKYEAASTALFSDASATGSSGDTPPC